MGWKAYSSFSGIPISNNRGNIVVYDDEKLTKYFLVDKERKSLFLIRELTEKEKQTSKKLYKFIVHNYEEDKKILKDYYYGLTLKKFNKNFKVKEIEFDSNTELMNLIIENESCSPDYQRHFRINKLFRK